LRIEWKHGYGETSGDSAAAGSQCALAAATIGTGESVCYDDQDFISIAVGCCLRGNNGTGKSRVLALQLPFLLDGETSPHRVEPDGDSAKRFEWNLLMGKYDDRLGYTWIEFGRRDDAGCDHYLTLGCGVRAVSGKASPGGGFSSRRKDW